MAESQQHIILVRDLYLWVRDNLFAGDHGTIFVDLPEISKKAKPPCLSSGVRPDLYAIKPKDNMIILGEAKTPDDLETRHSIMQYNYYIEECENRFGPALIVMAVPWFMQRTANNLLMSLLKKKNANKTQIKVLEKLPS